MLIKNEIDYTYLFLLSLIYYLFNYDEIVIIVVFNTTKLTFIIFNIFIAYDNINILQYYIFTSYIGWIHFIQYE